MDNIFAKGCLIQLSVSIWGGRVKLPNEAIRVDADPAFIAATKYLVEKDVLKPIKKVRNKARAYIYNKSLPFPITGILFVPKDLISDIDRKLNEYKYDFNNRVSNFVLNYNEFISIARLRLSSLFNPVDYPADIRRHFGFVWRFFTMDAPGEAQLISPEIYEREKEKFTETMSDFRNMAVAALRVSFAEMVDHIIGRLLGEKKIFRDSLIGNIKEFMADFEVLNINNDTELSILVEKCRLILNNVGPQSLRDNDSFRAHIANKVSEVQSCLGTMLVDRPTRKLKFVGNMQ